MKAMQPGAPEHIVAILPEMFNGMDYFDLIFTDRRIVAARTRAANVGGIGGLIVQAVRDPGGPARYAGMSFDQIIAKDKLNVGMPYSQIQSAVLSGGTPGWTVPSLRFVVEGKKRKYALFGRSRKKHAAELQSTRQLLTAMLGARAQFKNL